MNALGGSVFFSRLVSEAPLLAVAVVGIILAAVKLRRAAQFCGLFGCILLVVGTLIAALAQSYLVELPRNGQVQPADLGMYYSVLGFGTGAMRAASFGLILTAALVGRSPQVRRD